MLHTHRRRSRRIAPAPEGGLDVSGLGTSRTLTERDRRGCRSRHSGTPGGGVVTSVADETSSTPLVLWAPTMIGPRRQARRDPGWLPLTTDPSQVSDARRHAVEMVERYTLILGLDPDSEHVQDVRLIVSELVTNAMRAAVRIAIQRQRQWEAHARPVKLRVVCRRRWTHVMVI